MEDEGEDNIIYNSETEGNLRLVSLLGFKKETPTRTRLMQSLLKVGILQKVFPEVRELYQLLEKTFGPLTMKNELTRLLDRLNQLGQNQNTKYDVSKYIEPIKTLAILRLLEQLSRVYKTMRIEKFQSLAPDVNWICVERFINQNCSRRRLRIQN
eukprot:TRINITY_DN6904_c0_g1_i1.p1 TRINITY_DN6904_c0_g1~~TRINITY_DN6904_c0_g1_i1.p1  ORF type:complete len:155 (-),score=11.46 TRINITY_DN6904_c0_g1_i1:197-661(-)